MILLGHVANRGKLAELYRGASAYIHPAHYEGLPTVLLEAMACRRPVIATAVSGALDVIKDSQNGLLIPPHSPEQLADAVTCIIQNPDFGEQLGTAAYHTVQERFSWQVVSRNYLNEYEKLLQGVVL